MDTSRREQLPPDLVRGRSQFQKWRGQRTAGGRIPEALWAMATRLASAHGVSRTAAALGLDYYRLKKRAEVAAGDPRVSGPAFVELPAPVAVARRCRLDLDNGSGATMRVLLVGYDAADIEALSRGLSLCQMLWTGFDSGGVLDLDPVDEPRPRDHGPEAG